MKLTIPARILITCSLMLAAMVCYLVGYIPGFKGFFFLGIALETAFWIRLFHNRPKRRERLAKLKTQSAE